MSEPSRSEVLTPEELEVLRLVLDQVLPASSDGRLPGAGELGIAPEVAAATAQNPFLLAVLRRSLARVAAAAATRGEATLAGLPPAERSGLFQQVVAAEPDFVPGLLFPTYVAYYQHPRVLEGLGQEPRPPFPKGYSLPPFDESLLAPVRSRGLRLRS